MPVKRLAVMVSGFGSNLQSLIDASRREKSKFKIVIVISSDPNSYGLERAKINGIPSIWIAGNNSDSQIISVLEENQIDLVVLGGYLEILGKEIIDLYRWKIINIHPSIIPRYSGKGFYGAKVHGEVIRNGDAYTGATVHFVDEGIDTGSVLIRGTVPVDMEDTIESLQFKVSKVEHYILVEAVKRLCDF